MLVKNLKGLVVGINDFVGSSNDLSGCVNDAKDISRLLLPATGSVDAIDRSPFFHCTDAVTSLLDKQATLKPAVEKIGAFLSDLKDGEMGFMWFSQHGTYIRDTNGDEPDKTDEALVFQDFGLLVDDKLCKLIKGRNPKSLLFIGTDACHSGTVHRMYVPSDRKVTHRVRYLPPDRLPTSHHPRPLQLRKLGSTKATNQDPLPNVVHFAGCQDTEYCYDAVFKGRPNGAFTYYLLKALATLKPGATFGDWFSALCGYLPSVEYAQKPKCNALPAALGWQLPLRKD